MSFWLNDVMVSVVMLSVMAPFNKPRMGHLLKLFFCFIKCLTKQNVRKRVVKMVVDKMSG